MAAHAEQLAEHGGAEGVRDAAALESAMMRPRNLAEYAQPDIAALAAAYADAAHQAGHSVRELAVAELDLPLLRTAEVLMIRPDELCLCAAHNGDLKAARACGLKTAFVSRPTEHGPDQATDLAPSEAWDVVAADFQDLAQKLGC